MSWFKVDDKFCFHPKVVACSNSAIGLWVRAGSWCAANLTDGQIPAKILPEIGRRRDAEQLVSVALWEKTDNGYRFHDWESMNPSRRQVEADRAATKRRVERFRSRRSNAVTNGVGNGVGNGSPDPGTPKGVPRGGGRAALEGRPSPSPDGAHVTTVQGPEDDAEVIHLDAKGTLHTDDSDSYERRAELARRNNWPECWI